VVETLASLRYEVSDERTELSLPRTERLRSLDDIQHLRERRVAVRSAR
jgi:hypothetical protein